MTQLRDREELRDTMSESERLTTVVPTAEEVRAIVEGPPRRRQFRWMRWLGAFVALVLAASITALLLRGDESTTEPEIFAGTEWIISVDSPQFESLPVEQPIGLPENGYLRATQTPHGVSFDFVLVTQTPHGVSIDAFVPAAYPGNPTQLPEGTSTAGTAYQGLDQPAIFEPLEAYAQALVIENYVLPEASVAEGTHRAMLENYVLPEMSVAEGVALAVEANLPRIAPENFVLPEMSVAEGIHNAFLENWELPEMTVAEGMEAAAS